MALDAAPPGLLGSARLMLSVLLEIGQTRLQLASTEIEEERLRLAQMLIAATLALFFLGLALVLLSMLLLVLFWDEYRLLVLAALSAVYLAAGIGMAWRWQQRALARPPLLASTLAELGRDRDALAGIGRAPR